VRHAAEKKCMKESAYNLCAKDADGNRYLFNTRLGTTYVMSARAYAACLAASAGEPGSEDVERTRRDLMQGGFLVDDGLDELAAIESAHRRAREDSEELHLVLAPSMACNLDCFYCFEANRYPRLMSRETQDNVVRLVRSYLDGGTKRLNVVWYGGEPLLARSVIGSLSTRFMHLCKRLRRAYAAEIVTNGTLLTRETARLAAWQVKRAQITLDGIPALHDARRVPKNRSPTFHRILEAIAAAAPHMQVTIRINVCRQTAGHLEELLRILAARGLDTTTNIYIAPLQKTAAIRLRARSAPNLPRGERAQVHDHDLETLDDREFAELEIRFRELLSKYRFPVSDRLPAPCRTTCVTDKRHGWLIEANGDVQKCYWTAGMTTEAVGHLASSGIVLRAAYRKWEEWERFRNPHCRRCVMLPICLGRCPLKHVNGQFHCCPSFRHNWVQCLAWAARVPSEELVPARLPVVQIATGAKGV